MAHRLPRRANSDKLPGYRRATIRFRIDRRRPAGFARRPPGSRRLFRQYRGITYRNHLIISSASFLLPLVSTIKLQTKESISVKPQNDRFYSFRRHICLLAVSLFAMAASQGAVQAQDKQRSGSAQAPVSTAARAGVVNINTATENELVLLPNIGPSRAKAILELRNRLGRFRRAEDLIRVRGIGRKTFRKLNPMLVLQGPTTLTAKIGKTMNAMAGQGPASPATPMPAGKKGN
jgi:competence protein ComEA